MSLPKISPNSRSMFREEKYLDYINNKTSHIQEILAKEYKVNKSGELQEVFKLNKTQRRQALINSQIITKKIIANTKLFQPKTTNEILPMISKLKQYIEDNYINKDNLDTIIEFHKADNTINSNHIHFWSNDDSQELVKVIKDFIIQEDMAEEKDFKNIIQENTKSIDGTDIIQKYPNNKTSINQAIATNQELTIEDVNIDEIASYFQKQKDISNNKQDFQKQIDIEIQEINESINQKINSTQIKNIKNDMNNIENQVNEFIKDNRIKNK